MLDALKLQSKPLVLLRFGLGLVFLYAGAHALAYADGWLEFVPSWVAAVIPLRSFLFFHSVGTVLLGALLIANVKTHWLALIAALDLFAILAFAGIDETTFRDFGLLMAALALFFESGGMEKLQPNREQ